MVLPPDVVDSDLLVTVEVDLLEVPEDWADDLAPSDLFVTEEVDLLDPAEVPVDRPEVVDCVADLLPLSFPEDTVDDLVPLSGCTFV